MSDRIFDGIIVGAAAAAIGTIIAFKFMNREPEGKGQPAQPVNWPMYNAPGGHLTIWDQSPLPEGVAPMVQSASPTTEAAYNTYPTKYGPSLGPNENRDSEEIVLPV